MTHEWVYFMDVSGAFPGSAYRCRGCGATVVFDGEPDPRWEDSYGRGHDELVAASVIES